MIHRRAAEICTAVQPGTPSFLSRQKACRGRRIRRLVVGAGKVGEQMKRREKCTMCGRARETARVKAERQNTQENAREIVFDTKVFRGSLTAFLFPQGQCDPAAIARLSLNLWVSESGKSFWLIPEQSQAQSSHLTWAQELSQTWIWCTVRHDDFSNQLCSHYHHHQQHL